MKPKTYLLAMLFAGITTQISAQQQSYYGHDLTPQGELHVLTIFAQLSTDNVANANWPLNQKPVWADDLFDIK